MLTDNTGAAVGTFTYDPYGSTTATTGTATTPIGYAGGYKDTESGFVYLVNRYYNPTTSQFLTPDPLDAITNSTYGYVGDSPLNATDPTGLCKSNGNGDAWDLFNPWSSNNPIRCSVQKNPNSTTTQILEDNPAYRTINAANSAYVAAQSPCTSNWTIARDSASAFGWSLLTVASAAGTALGAARLVPLAGRLVLPASLGAARWLAGVNLSGPEENVTDQTPPPLGPSTGPGSTGSGSTGPGYTAPGNTGPGYTGPGRPGRWSQ